MVVTWITRLVRFDAVFRRELVLGPIQSALQSHSWRVRLQHLRHQRMLQDCHRTGIGRFRQLRKRCQPILPSLLTELHTDLTRVQGKSRT